MENEGFRTTNRQVVEEAGWGMYVWQTPDGEILGDGDGNVMNVFTTKGNQKSIQALTDAARHYGFPEGQAVWWSGKRRIDDEELEYQQSRERLGLVPDPLDVGALRDEARNLKRNE